MLRENIVGSPVQVLQELQEPQSETPTPTLNRYYSVSPSKFAKRARCAGVQKLARIRLDLVQP